MKLVYELIKYLPKLDPGQDFVKVRSGRYLVGEPGMDELYIDMDEYMISKRPVSNRDFVRFLNIATISNEIEGTFRWGNTDHINSKIKRTGETFFEEKAGYHILSGPLDSEHKYAVVPGYEDYPVICVNWYGAYLYCLASGCRLPTEAEWEVAAKSCNDGFIYEWGTQPPTKEHANFGGFYGEMTRIGVFPPNDLGLSDMTGNTREWCLDWYDPKIKYTEDRKIELPANRKCNKVIKGCGWNRGQSSMQCYKRTGKWPRLGGANIGFRLVRVTPTNSTGFTARGYSARDFVKPSPRRHTLYHLGCSYIGVSLHKNL